MSCPLHLGARHRCMPACQGSQHPTSAVSPSTQPHRRCTAPAAAVPRLCPRLVQGVSEEVRLIKWPSPVKAAINTVLVIGIVAGTAALLLAINGALSELSNVLY